MKTFPMFLKMTGREVLIVGGGEQAAQKTRLMLKTEARVTILATALDDELQALVESGRISHDPGPIGPERFAGAALVFIATGCPGADTAIHAMAHRAGAPVNVVDRPDLCDAFTPSIVDRDPVVVAIGTEGTAPVLARQIKTRVEEMLEPRLGDLAAMAGRLRGAVARGVPQDRRRAFWRWVFNGAPRRLHATGAEREAGREIKAAIHAQGAPTQDEGAGLVSFVGIGPGARDLLTLRAVQRLQEADVIFHDRLVDPDLLEVARRDAERVPMGAAPGALRMPQARADTAVVIAARQGKRVVRLVPGCDPSDSAEYEGATLAGISVELVPGAVGALTAPDVGLRAAGQA
ncbi:siroheme synthase [Tropicimonas marinistellae]|uniref:siroheme synthase family protein n=1 Tax=Tropicimonas marinistellae TaxID=1739787 RepID=UPI00083297F0|nr:NAD(P)-dependent oxidoreductase [Tropicimonas marinistellae]